MDVDIIFKRGLSYTFATGAVVGIYFAIIALIGELFHRPGLSPALPAESSPSSSLHSYLNPLREGVQTRLDHFFYRDRLDYRRTLIEFGRTLTNEVRLEPLVGSVLDRISQTLLVDRLAVFLEDAANPGSFVLSRSMGLHSRGPARSLFSRCRIIPRSNAAACSSNPRAPPPMSSRFRPPHSRTTRSQLFHRLPFPRSHCRHARPRQNR